MLVAMIRRLRAAAVCPNTNIYMYIYIYIYIYLCLYLYLHLSIYLSIYRFMYIRIGMDSWGVFTTAPGHLGHWHRTFGGSNQVLGGVRS